MQSNKIYIQVKHWALMGFKPKKDLCSENRISKIAWIFNRIGLYSQKFKRKKNGLHEDCEVFSGLKSCIEKLKPTDW